MQPIYLVNMRCVSFLLLSNPANIFTNANRQDTTTDPNVPQRYPVIKVIT